MGIGTTNIKFSDIRDLLSTYASYSGSYSIHSMESAAYANNANDVGGSLTNSNPNSASEFANWKAKTTGTSYVYPTLSTTGASNGHISLSDVDTNIYANITFNNVFTGLWNIASLSISGSGYGWGTDTYWFQDPDTSIYIGYVVAVGDTIDTGAGATIVLTDPHIDTAWNSGATPSSSKSFSFPYPPSGVNTPTWSGIYTASYTAINGFSITNGTTYEFPYAWWIWQGGSSCSVGVIDGAGGSVSGGTGTFYQGTSSSISPTVTRSGTTYI